jgi:hypothetical protein
MAHLGGRVLDHLDHDFCAVVSRLVHGAERAFGKEPAQVQAFAPDMPQRGNVGVDVCNRRPDLRLVCPVSRDGHSTRWRYPLRRGTCAFFSWSDS